MTAECPVALCRFPNGVCAAKKAGFNCSTLSKDGKIPITFESYNLGNCLDATSAKDFLKSITRNPVTKHYYKGEKPSEDDNAPTYG